MTLATLILGRRGYLPNNSRIRGLSTVELRNHGKRLFLKNCKRVKRKEKQHTSTWALGARKKSFFFGFVCNFTWSTSNVVTPPIKLWPTKTSVQYFWAKRQPGKNVHLTPTGIDSCLFTSQQTLFTFFLIRICWCFRTD